MIVAPIIGIVVDLISDSQGLGGNFWPVAAIAAVFALLMLLTPLKDRGGDQEKVLECEDVCMVEVDDID